MKVRADLQNIIALLKEKGDQETIRLVSEFVRACQCLFDLRLNSLVTVNDQYGADMQRAIEAVQCTALLLQGRLPDTIFSHVTSGLALYPQYSAVGEYLFHLAL